MAYATIAQFDDLGYGAEFLRQATPEQKRHALEMASRVCDGYLGQRYALPLIAWTPDLERAVLMIAAYDIYSARGYDPTSPDNEHIRQRYLDAIEWLTKIANGELTPDWEDEEAGDGYVGPEFRSLPPVFFPPHTPPWPPRRRR